MKSEGISNIREFDDYLVHRFCDGIVRGKQRGPYTRKARISTLHLKTWQKKVPSRGKKEKKPGKLLRMQEQTKGLLACAQKGEPSKNKGGEGPIQCTAGKKKKEDGRTVRKRGGGKKGRATF